MSRGRFWKPMLFSLAGLAGACVASAQQQGRYIVYIEPAQIPQLQSSAQKTARLAEWGQILHGQLQLERELATGGWVILVDSDAPSADAQLQAVMALPGVETAEPDALMRHQ